MNESSLRELRNFEKDRIANKANIERQKISIVNELMNSTIKEDLEGKREEPNWFKKFLLKLFRVCS